MDLTLLNPINLAALAMSAMALTMSTLAVFPWLKSAAAVMRDAILWVALVLVLGSSGFLTWHAVRTKTSATTTAIPAGENASATTRRAPTPGFTYSP